MKVCFFSCSRLCKRSKGCSKKLAQNRNPKKYISLLKSHHLKLNECFRGLKTHVTINLCKVRFGSKNHSNNWNVRNMIRGSRFRSSNPVNPNVKAQRQLQFSWPQTCWADKFQLKLYLMWKFIHCSTQWPRSYDQDLLSIFWFKRSKSNK